MARFEADWAMAGLDPDPGGGKGTWNRAHTGAGVTKVRDRDLLVLATAK